MAKWGQIRRLMRSALSNGPKTMRELVPIMYAERLELGWEAVYHRTGNPRKPPEVLSMENAARLVTAARVSCIRPQSA